MSRSLTYSGTGTLSTWLEPSGLRNQIATSLTANGWGFTGLKVTGGLAGASNAALAIVNPIIQQIANAASYNYNIEVTLTDAPADDNPERGRVALTNLFSQWFTAVDLRLTHDTAHPATSFLQNYGLWIAGGLAAVLVLRSLQSTAVAYAPVARSYYVHR